MTTTEIPGLNVERDVPATMLDGTVLFADVYRPEQPGDYPVILMRNPYDKTQAQTNTYAHPSWYARRGYVVVIQDTRGRWASGGEFYPFRHEMDDGYDTVEWAASLPGTTGRVGMYGFSYAGATQLLASVSRPPHLACICPGLTGSQYYEGWAYNGGAFALAFNLSWATRLAQDIAKRRELAELAQDLWVGFQEAPSHYRHVPLSEFRLLKRENIAPYFYDWLAHPAYDDYWRRWSVDERYGQIGVPALHIAGWYDIFKDGTIKNFNALREDATTDEARNGQKLLVGPWYHAPWAGLMGQRDFGDEARNGVDDLQLRWFDHWLKDEDSGVLDEPPVKVFALGEDRWKEFPTWPPPNVEFQPFYLHSDGRANTLDGDGTLSSEQPNGESWDIYTYDPQSPVPSLGGHSCCNRAIAPMGPMDQRPAEQLASVLVYTTAPLEQTVTIAGPVSLRLWVASSAVDTDVTGKLVDVYPNGRAINLTEGILRMRYRDSLSQPSLLQPWEVYEVTVELGNTCAVFGAGHCIRVEVSSSNFPHWDRNTNTGRVPAEDNYPQFVVATQLVFHDTERPSHVMLPVVPE